MEFPNSSVVRSADYHPDRRTLDVTFTSSRRYTCFNMPDWEFDGLITTGSAGEYSTPAFAINMRARNAVFLSLKATPGAVKPRQTIH
jgi:lysyl-tRNA synthetase class 2